MLKEFSKSVAEDVSHSLSTENKQFDPISIGLIVFSVLFNLYKLCKEINIDRVRKPSILQRWTLKRLISKTIDKDYPEADPALKYHVYVSLLNKGKTLSPFNLDRIKIDLER